MWPAPAMRRLLTSLGSSPDLSTEGQWSTSSRLYVHTPSCAPSSLPSRKPSIPDGSLAARSSPLLILFATCSPPFSPSSSLTASDLPAPTRALSSFLSLLASSLISASLAEDPDFWCDVVMMEEGQRRATRQPLLRVGAQDLLRASHVGEEGFVGFQGVLDYWHYNMDDTRDAGWGCGYRTLQTMASWLHLQGHTNNDPPTHPEIQATLVKEGEKPQHFLGSREWIGTVEAGRILQAWCNAEFRIIELPSGREAWTVSLVKKLLEHFQTIGSPVMCGGTTDNVSRAILGVMLDVDIADCDDSSVLEHTKLLIMDPHFIRGESDEQHMQTKDASLRHLFQKRWLSWRPLTSFEAGSHYNLCCPIPDSMLVSESRRQQQQQRQEEEEEESAGVQASRTPSAHTAKGEDDKATADNKEQDGGFGIVVVDSGQDA